MSDEKKITLAREVYKTLCDALTSKGWTFDRVEEKLLVRFDVSGDDIPMRFGMFVDADRQLVRLLSPIGFDMNEDKRMDGAIAVCVASNGMINGSFDYDLNDGSITFRMVQSYKGSMLGKEVFCYMIDCACAMVDRYNDRFFALNKGIMSLSDFIAKES